MFKSWHKACITDLFIQLKYVAEVSGNNSSLWILLRTTSNSESFTAPCLTVGKYGTIVTADDTENKAVQVDI